LFVTAKARYGVDGFPYLVGLLGGGAVLAIAGVATAVLAGSTVVRAVAVVVALLAAAALVPGFLGLRYVLGGKERHRDRMLDLIPWAGDEAVLDVGTGAGLLAIGAAKRVPAGRVIACDIWAAKDLSGNGIERTRHNAEIEGVSGRVDIRTEDARRLELTDQSIDVVLSALCFHNIPEEEGRRAALSEVFRVLRPGGRVVIADLDGVEQYAEWLRNAGCTRVEVTNASGTFPPQRVITAIK
jgi:SAM-dependent methyltransferase